MKSGICSKCHGSGKQLLRVHHSGYESKINCFDCFGTGYITKEMIERIERGEKFRELVIKCNIGNKTIAHRMNEHSSVVSDYERGKVVSTDFTDITKQLEEYYAKSYLMKNLQVQYWQDGFMQTEIIDSFIEYEWDEAEKLLAKYRKQLWKGLSAVYELVEYRVFPEDF